MPKNNFHLTGSQLDALSAEFRARSVQAGADVGACHAWELAAQLIHQHRMAAHRGRTAKARSARLTLQSREFAATL